MQFASDAAGTSTSLDANPWGAREEDFSWGLDKRMSARNTHTPCASYALLKMHAEPNTPNIMYNYTCKYSYVYNAMLLLVEYDFICGIISAVASSTSSACQQDSATNMQSVSLTVG